jgi:hypothetical protein
MARTIKDKGPTVRLVNPSALAKALGADEINVEIDSGQGPISLFALRRFLADRLRCTVGRPGLKGTTNNSNNIHLFEELARYYRETEGLNVSSGQIASA